jgi:hypothetical protein
MRVKEMRVGPPQAIKWLEGNVHNRSVRDSVVQRYARDMKAGQWKLTHEALAFDPQGTLIDGQHRLYAVIEADTEVDFMVAFDADMSTQGVIDGSLPRTMVDVMRLAYDRTDVTTMDIAIAKALVENKTKGVLTRQETKQALDTHAAAIAYAVTAFPRKVRFVTIVPVLTVVARAFYSVDHTVLKRFCESLASGRISDDEASVLMLRNWLLEKAPRRGKGGVSQRSQIYGKTERALDAFVKGEHLSTLYAATQELFPLPIEKTTRAAKVARIRPKATTTVRKRA